MLIFLVETILLEFFDKKMQKFLSSEWKNKKLNLCHCKSAAGKHEQNVSSSPTYKDFFLQSHHYLKLCNEFNHSKLGKKMLYRIERK
jgi:hypothetical protein